MLAPGTILQGRYEIMQLIAQGGMGAVYMAKDERLGSVVALKETFFTDDRLRKAFEREARLLANLRHSVLPKVIDHFSENEGQFLVMEYIRGDDLGVILEKRKERVEPKGKPKPFSVDEVIAWGDQLLDALDYLHTRQPPIIHRDIKPQNLKLAERGQIVLLDFGLAKGTLLQMSRMTSSGSIFGYTPSYAPLEQIQGGGTDGRSDIYSLASTLYHLLTGVAPIDALTRATAVLTDEADPLLPANQIEQQVPPAIAAVLARAMAQNRNVRPRSAVEMREAMREASRSSVSRINTGSNTASGASFPVAENPNESIASNQNAVRSDSIPQIRSFSEADRFAFDSGTARRPDSATGQAKEPSLPSVTVDHTYDLASSYANPIGGRKKRVSPKVWLSIGGAVILMIAFAVAVLSIILSKKESPPVNAPVNAARVEPGSTPAVPIVEAASYYLQLEQTDGKAAASTGFDPLPGNQKYKLRFTPEQAGYLYIIAPGTGRAPTTYLTSIPIPATGVRTNRVEAKTDFEFPGGDNWLRVRDDSDTTQLSIIFSPVLLDDPMLKATAGQRLTTEENNRLESLATRAQVEPGSNRVVIKTAGTASSKPLIFDIRIKRK